MDTQYIQYITMRNNRVMLNLFLSVCSLNHIHTQIFGTTLFNWIKSTKQKKNNPMIISCSTSGLWELYSIPLVNKSAYRILSCKTICTFLLTKGIRDKTIYNDIYSRHPHCHELEHELKKRNKHLF